MVVARGRASMRATGHVILLACALCALCASLACARAASASGASASASAMQTSDAAAAPPAQGVYEGCAPGTSPATLERCVRRLQEIAEGGFGVVLNYSAFYGAPDQVRAYAEAASALAIRLIWPLHHASLRREADVSGTFRSMAAACGCGSPRRLVPYMIDVVSSLPATWLYYVGDEVPVAERDAMLAVSRLVRAVDPTHERLIVQYGTGSELEPFADTADVLGLDHYPLLPGSGGAEDVAAAAAGAERIAAATGRTMAMVLQAFSWGPYYQPIAPRWPTVAEYTAMRDATLAVSAPRVVLWWAYYVIKRESEPERHWNELVAGAMAPAASPGERERPDASPDAPPGPVAPAPGAPSPAPAAAGPAAPAERVVVRALSAGVTQRIAVVRFALSSPSRVDITLRCGGRIAGRRAAHGGPGARRVRLWVMNHRGACRVTLAPEGGAARTVWAPVRVDSPQG